jgi:hypothetical protein
MTTMPVEQVPELKSELEPEQDENWSKKLEAKKLIAKT